MMGNKRRIGAAILCVFVLLSAFFAQGWNGEWPPASLGAAAEQDMEQWYYSNVITEVGSGTDEPSQTPPALEAEDGQDTQEPLPEETLSPEESLMLEEEWLAEEAPPSAPGSMLLGDGNIPAAAPGDALTLSVSLQYTRGGQIHASNAAPGEAGAIRPYHPGNGPEDYDQAIALALPMATIRLLETQAGDCPFPGEALGAEKAVVANGQNHGYAVFADMAVRQDALPGLYPIVLEISWEEDGARQTQWATAYVEVTETPAQASPAEVALGIHETPTAEAGGKVTLAFPIRYMREEQVYDTNESAEGEAIPYESGFLAFDQSLTGELLELTVTVDPEQAEDFPLAEGVLEESRALVSQGENNGYAVFEEVPVRADAQPGNYPIRLRVSWRDMQNQAHSATITAAMELTPFSMPFEDGVIVFTFDELKTAIETQGHTKIYLGHCLADPQAGETVNGGVISVKLGGITVPRSVTIIGTDPRKETGGRVKIIDYNSLAETDTIRAGAAGITMTLKNADVEGRNFFGILCGAAFSGVGIEFEDVTYTGSQMAHSRGTNSWTSFRDCRVSIINVALSSGEEVAESAEIRLYGNNTFTRNGTGEFSVFWLKAAPMKITVEAGAYASVSTNDYFTWPGTGSALVVNGTLSVETTGLMGSMTYGTSSLSEVTVGGSLRVRHNTASAHHTLRTGKLTVTGSLDMERPSSSTYSCIQLIGSGASAVFDSPARVSLQNSGGMLLRAEIGGTYSISTQAMNLWPTGSSAKNIWNNNELSAWTVSGTVTTTGTTVSGISGLPTGKGAAIGAITLDGSSFHLGKTSRMLLGRYAAAIDEDSVFFTSSQVTGTAPGGAAHTLREYQGASSAAGDLLQSVTPDMAGNRFQTSSDWNPISGKDNRVYLLSSLDDLEIHIYKDCKEVCFLYEVPSTLDFGTAAIAPNAQWVKRQVPDWTLRILDTRAAGTWQLTAAATPLTRTDGEDTLPSALVFVGSDGTPRNLASGSSVLIAERPAAATPGIMAVNWPEEEGLLIRLEPYEGTPGMSYTATIVWTLEDS